MAEADRVRTWHRNLPSGDRLLISTSTALVDRNWLNAAFATPDMYWAKSVDAETLETMLVSSVNLGLYRLAPSSEPSSPRTPSPTLEPTSPIQPSEDPKVEEQIGFARLISDRVSTACLSDVYINPGARGQGLAQWLMECVREVMEAMPAGRRGLLLVTPGPGVEFYERTLGFTDVQNDRDDMVVMSRNLRNLG